MVYFHVNIYGDWVEYGWVFDGQEDRKLEMSRKVKTTLVSTAMAAALSLALGLFSGAASAVELNPGDILVVDTAALQRILIVIELKSETLLCIC